VSRVIVTRPREQATELVHELQALGYEVVACPLIELESLGDDPIDVSGYDWIVLTSVNGARELRRRMHGRPRHVAAIGRATAEAFGGADIVPAVATQEGLLAELPRPAGRVLFAGAEGARRLLADALGADFVPLYRTVELRPASRPEGDLVVLASPSAARALAAFDTATPVVTIGPETTAAAQALGLAVVREAETQDVRGLVGAVQVSLASAS
jgi:uroporphyrinogen III methyltransferase/synthase